MSGPRRPAAPPRWRVVLDVPAAAVDRVGDLLAAAVAPPAASTDAAGRTWRIEALADASPDRPLLERLIAALAAELALPIPLPSIEHAPAVDWLAENRRSFPPLRRGRFLIVGSHHGAVARSGLRPIRLDAGAAFGSGSHGSTAGCLIAIDRLALRRRHGRPWGRVLDMGCGSGVLAIAAARAGARRVLAVDFDPIAVASARANARRNGVAARVATALADGPRRRAVRAPFDLVLANILARPLRRMARDLARALRPSGRLVLAGLLAEDAPSLIAAARMQGLALERRIAIEGWTTLILRRGT